jgi:hypothetical protein
LEAIIYFNDDFGFRCEEMGFSEAVIVPVKPLIASAIFSVLRANVFSDVVTNILGFVVYLAPANTGMFPITAVAHIV